MRYPFDENGFYTYNSIDTDEVLPNTSSVDPSAIPKPKIIDPLDPDSGWVIGLTEEEKVISHNDVITIRDQYLSETTPQVVANLRERIPIPQWVKTSRENAMEFERVETLRIYPDYVFPDYSQEPKHEITYRTIATSAGTSITLGAEASDAEILREVSIEGQPVYAFSYDPETRVLSGINVSVGDHIKVMY